MNDAGYNFLPGKEELKKLYKQLNGFLHTLKTVDAPERAGDYVAGMPVVFAYDSPPQYIESPPKCQWQYQEDFNGFGFRFRENGKILAFFGTLFLATFWNGILSPLVLIRLGVLELDGRLDWVFLVFMIPFGLIGLILFWAEFEAFLELCRRTSWRFAYGEAVFRTARLLPARAKRYDLAA